MPLKRRGAGKREPYEPVSLHPFPGVFVFRGGDLCRVRFSGTPPAQGPGQIHPVVFLAVPARRYWDCLGDVPVLQVEHPRVGRFSNRSGQCLQIRAMCSPGKCKRAAPCETWVPQIKLIEGFPAHAIPSSRRALSSRVTVEG